MQQFIYLKNKASKITINCSYVDNQLVLNYFMALEDPHKVGCTGISALKYLEAVKYILFLPSFTTRCAVRLETQTV